MRFSNMNPISKLTSLFQGNDLDAIRQVITTHPDVLKNDSLLPRAVRHGSLAVVKFLCESGAKNIQKALGSICYGNKRDIAEYLVSQGASMHTRDNYGLPMLGTCEVLNPDAMQVCLDLTERPYTREELCECVAMVLTTYSRNPTGKHKCLDLLDQAGFDFPEGMVMAFHRVDLEWLRKHLTQNSADLERPLALTEIYPEEIIGEAADGLHLTPLDGSTLLHLAVAFHEIEMVELFLEMCANVNVKSIVDSEGYGGQTPLFHTVISYPPHRDHSCSLLLGNGADSSVRVNLRKQLRYMEDPALEKMFVFKNVNPLEYAEQFQVPRWINHQACKLLSEG